MEQMTKSIQGVIDIAWPMVFISIVIAVSLRLTYLIKKREHFALYKELLMLSFLIYVLCLFQIVTFQDDASWSSNNFIPFREMFRYEFGSRLFIKNVLGNIELDPSKEKISIKDVIFFNSSSLFEFLFNSFL